MTSNLSPGLISSAANYLGTNEPALRLLISILFTFPLGIFYRQYLFRRKPLLQHLYFILFGLIIHYFNYGVDIIHPIITIVLTYLTLFFMGGTSLSVAIIFIFTMSYLLIGYYQTGTNDYDIKWTMPQCVLTLRLIGLAYDVYDSSKPIEKASAYQKSVRLEKTPSFLEVVAHSFFPASFLVGPQFPIRRYKDFVAGHFCEPGRDLPDSLGPGIKRTIIGFIYLGLFQIGSTFLPDSYILSPEYDDLALWKRLLLLGLWAKITFYKYISCWLLTEGACTVFGLTYNKNSKGEISWDGLANVKLRTFENASVFNHFILSFNINTNHWVAEYIYKRLKFLGNRLISQSATLLFLAVWHGLHSGYYACFFMEFIIMYFEKDIEPYILKHKGLQKSLENPFISLLVGFLQRLYTFVFMGYSLAPFGFLSFDRYMHIYRSNYYIGYVFFLSWPIVGIFVKKWLKQSQKEIKNSTPNQNPLPNNCIEFEQVKSRLQNLINEKLSEGTRTEDISKKEE